MRKVPAPMLTLLTFASLFAAFPCKAASRPQPAPAQAGCAAVKLNNNDGKFTGQISSGPNGSLFEVTSGSDTLLVRYNNSVPVCAGGQAASVSALSLGATVVVYGPTKRKGKVTEMDAMNIVMAGPSPAGMRGGEAMSFNVSVGARGGAEPMGGNSGSGASQMSGSGGDRAGSPVGSQSHSGNQNSGTISCNALLFSVTSSADPMGHGGRAPSIPITCKRSVDQLAVQLTQDASTRRRIPTVTLNLQNQLEATLSNADITSIQFVTDNGTPAVEITFTSQKVEIVHVPSGTRATF
jgi:hypothetical protein